MRLTSESSYLVKKVPKYTGKTPVFYKSCQVNSSCLILAVRLGALAVQGISSCFSVSSCLKKCSFLAVQIDQIGYKICLRRFFLRSKQNKISNKIKGLIDMKCKISRGLYKLPNPCKWGNV